jgi:homoserine O-acetyltransferase
MKQERRHFAKFKWSDCARRAAQFPILSLLLPGLLSAPALDAHEVNYPEPDEGSFIVHHFKFASGETMPEVKIHYWTLGAPVKNESGKVINAVLVLHGTAFGTGLGALRSRDVLYSPGQPLDANRYYLIFPDSIGHGQSSKPSDGLHAKFAHYNYTDMVELQYRLVTEHLHVNHLRLVTGNSMGGMHTYLWGEMYPDFMDALLPLACSPDEIGGRNRMWRKIATDAMSHEPDYARGEYKTQPYGLTVAMQLASIFGPGVPQLQREASSRAQADALLAKSTAGYLRSQDTNDMLYAFESSRDYNAAPKLAEIRAPLTAVNFADDQINPQELGIMEKEIKLVKHGRYVLVPAGPNTRGHLTTEMIELWEPALVELLEESKN